MRLAALLAAAFGLAAPPALAQPGNPTPAPKLIVTISVDQLSADLFANYRAHFTGGLRRLADGAAFDGYQAHGATETCPGHSTILTGAHPARSGIVANNWIDLAAARVDKEVYCAEDESAPGSDAKKYLVSPLHLRVPTLGKRMKRADPASRIVAVAGKDRSAVMLAGHAPDQAWFWKDGAYRFLPGTTPAPIAADVNAAVADALSRPRPDLDVPALCAPRNRAIPVGAPGRTVGTHRFARTANDLRAFTASPEFDGATLAMAAALFQQMQLGRSAAPDLLAIGLSGTDYVGHYYGTTGVEMCLQLLSLDADLAGFFALLDRSGVDYAVVLTADHGGLDLPERQRLEGIPQAQRLRREATPKAIGEAVAAKLGLPGPTFAGDFFLTAAVPPTRRAEVLATARAMLASHPQVEAVWDAAAVAAHPMPTTPPERWSLLDRLRASFDPLRSGALLVVYKEYVTPIVDPGESGGVATHGSPWDYDRRVPILFWRKGLAAEDSGATAMTVDIAPTLASLVGLSIPAGEIDGKCLDIIAGAASNCR